MTFDERWLVDVITAFVREGPQNRLSRLDGGPIYEDPIVGLADGDDPLFADYKTIIGD